MMKSKYDDYYERSQVYRNSKRYVVDCTNADQETDCCFLTKDGPNEASFSRLPETTAAREHADRHSLWYFNSDDGEKDIESPLSDVYDDQEEASSANAGATVVNKKSPTGRQVRFCSEPDSVCRYDKPAAEYFNQLYYTVHEMQKMQDEFMVEQCNAMGSSAFERDYWQSADYWQQDDAADAANKGGD
jgi:hypothetical protein